MLLMTAQRREYILLRDVRFGSKADIEAREPDVRLPPKADIRWRAIYPQVARSQTEPTPQRPWLGAEMTGLVPSIPSGRDPKDTRVHRKSKSQRYLGHKSPRATDAPQLNLFSWHRVRGSHALDRLHKPC
jgi:hypothetical protein